MPLPLLIPLAAMAGTALGGLFGSKSQSDAAEENAKRAAETEALNYRMFQESQGSDGSAFLPMYTGNYESTSLFPSARRAFESNVPTNTAAFGDRLATLMAGQKQFWPAFDASTSLVNDLFSGALTDRRLGYAQPVANARNQVARASSAAIINGLKERLNAISSMRAKSGYTGGGTASELPLLRSTIGARGAAGQQEAQAAFDNALMTNQIKNEGWQLPLANMNLPMTQYQNAANFQMAPQQQMIQEYLNAMRVLQPFNIGNPSYQSAPMPQVQPVASTGQAIAAGVGVGANSLANYYANRNIGNIYSGAQLGNYGVQTPDNWSALDPNQQGMYINQARQASQMPLSGFQFS